MSEPTTIAYAYDPHGNLVRSQPIGASNDIIHLGATDKRLVNSSGQPMVPGPPFSECKSKRLSADEDIAVLAASKDNSVFTVISLSKAPPAEDTEPQVLI